MFFLIYLFINFLVVALFLYSKLLPYKDRLDNRYLKVFNFCGAIFNPILGFLKGLFKPFTVGRGLQVDMTQVVLLLFLLIILGFFR
ncbi:MAG: hypothetical protein JNM68_06930 [Dinghuibacter sp.]|nr:hypothetical protein [Dinghuibacter sp.]